MTAETDIGRDRIRAAQRAMRDRAKAASKAIAESEHHCGVAALRGKRTAYRECADLLEAVLRGGEMHAKYRSVEVVS